MHSGYWENKLILILQACTFLCLLQFLFNPATFAEQL